MAEVIDLRHKKELQAPPPPEEPTQELAAIEPEPEIQTMEVEPVSAHAIWITHLVKPPHRKNTYYLAIGLWLAALPVLFFFHDSLFAILLILSGLVLVLNLFRPHEPNRVAVHATGISIDDRHHHYADMRSFWIDYQPHIKEISIEFKHGLSPRLRIPLENQNPLEIRRVMIPFVPEREHELPFLEHIIRRLDI